MRKVYMLACHFIRYGYPNYEISSMVIQYSRATEKCNMVPDLSEILSKHV